MCETTVARSDCRSPDVIITHYSLSVVDKDHNIWVTIAKRVRLCTYYCTFTTQVSSSFKFECYVG